MATITGDMTANGAAPAMTKEERKVIFASSLGTVFEWYDFYLYGSLAVIIGHQFFSGLNEASQLVFALLLEVCHHVGHHSEAVHAGRWSSSPDFCFWDYPLIELDAKTMGIVGYGRIGRAAARIARAFGIPHLVATIPAQEDGAFTGKPRGIPAFKAGKIERVEAWLESLGLCWESFEKSSFYSDSHNDLPLMNKVNNPVAVDPDDTLRAHATAQGWPVISLRS